MTAFSVLKSQYDTAISSFDTYVKSILLKTEEVKRIENEILQKNRRQEDASALVSDRNSLLGDIQQAKTDLQMAGDTLQMLRNDYYATINQTTVIEELADDVPFLLLPIRIETRFHTYEQSSTDHYELWIRFFPDDVAIEGHEPELMQAEIDAGVKFWETYWTETDQVKIVNAWDALCRQFSAQRAAWIAYQLNPDNLQADPRPGDPFPDYAALELRYDSWTQAPKTRVLPDAFVVNLYSTYDENNPTTTYEEQTKTIPYNLKLGIDPNNEDSIDRDINDDITGDNDLKWMFDFQTAIDNGMGIKITITEQQYTAGFERLTVLGVKLLADEDQSKILLEDLINNHHYHRGFSLLRQGTRTKNSEDGPSGYTHSEFGNTLSYTVERTGDFVSDNSTTDETEKNDGQRLAEALGVDEEIFDHVYQSNGYDIRNAMHMSHVLFPATIGYFMDTIMYPMFSDSVITLYDPVEDTRDFATNFARSRGALSSIRVGRQPYGILPTSSFKHHENLIADPKKDYYDDLYDAMGTANETWSTEAQNVKIAGNSNYQEAFVQALGKKAVSKEHYLRYGVGPAYVWNNLTFNDMPAEAGQWYNTVQSFVSNAATETGFSFTNVPFSLEMNFRDSQGKVVAGLVDSQPLSEVHPVENFGNNENNYIYWLRTSDFATIRDENFGSMGGGEPPNNLFYVYLRQSILLDYYNAAAELLGLSDAQKREYEILNIDNNLTEEMEIPPQYLYTSGPSRWAIFEQEYQPGQTVFSFFQNPANLSDPILANVSKTLGILEVFEVMPTKDLATLFLEHLDFSAFRLDSWKLGLMNKRLNYLRLNSNGTVKKQGIYLGAYGWLENLNSIERTIIDNEELDLPSELIPSTGIESQNNNKGFIHAPSQNQAVTAAVLRAGYDANATDTDTNNHEINLTSERVRTARWIFDGLGKGQKLGALLGYELERGLHERWSLDAWIAPLRKKYKLDVLTTGYEGALAGVVGAVTVLDGNKLIEDYKSLSYSAFIAGIFSSAPGTTEQNNAKKEFDRITGILDAVSDLAIADGVFHLVNSNYEAAGALATALSGGTNPPEALVTKTPRTGLDLTNRVIINIPVTSHNFNTSEPSNTWGIIGKSPRAMCEPSLNAWLLNRIPNPNTIEIAATYEGEEEPVTIKVLLSDLSIQPIDLILTVSEKLVNDSSELCQRIARHVRNEEELAYNTEITIDFNAGPEEGQITIKSIHAYLLYLKKLVLAVKSAKTQDYHPGGVALTNLYDYSEIYTRVKNVLYEPNPMPTISGYYLVGLNELSSVLESWISQWTSNTGSVSFSSLLKILDRLAGFGLELTLPALDDTSDTDYQNALVATTQSVLKQAAAKAHQATDIFDNLPELSPEPSDSEKSAATEQLIAISKIIFGESFRLFPRLKVDPRLQETLNAKFDFFSTNLNTLLEDHDNDTMVVTDWLQDVAKVRKNMSVLDFVLTFNEGLMPGSQNPTNFMPFQVPYDDDDNDRWMAIEVNVESETDRAKLKSGRLSLILGQESNQNYTEFFNAMVLDEWSEFIPNQNETSGVAFHFDQPEAKPPQVLLLAVPPEITGNWTWGDLLATVNETLDQAKGRAVDYEALADTPYGHILPATYLPVSEGAMTIGPDFEVMENLTEV